MTGWDGKSVKAHVESAQNAASSAEHLAHEVSNKIEEFDDRISGLEAGLAQHHTSTDTMSVTDRLQKIQSDFEPMAKIVEALADHIAQTCDRDRLQGQGSEVDLLSYIQKISAGVEAMLLTVALDIRALATREQDAVIQGVTKASVL